MSSVIGTTDTQQYYIVRQLSLAPSRVSTIVNLSNRRRATRDFCEGNNQQGAYSNGALLKNKRDNKLRPTVCGPKNHTQRPIVEPLPKNTRFVTAGSYCTPNNNSCFEITERRAARYVCPLQLPVNSHYVMHQQYNKFVLTCMASTSARIASCARLLALKRAAGIILIATCSVHTTAFAGRRAFDLAGREVQSEQHHNDRLVQVCCP